MSQQVKLEYFKIMNRKNLTSDSSTRLLILPLWLLAIYAIGLLMSEASTICLWIVCAFFLFILLDPTTEYLKARRWPTSLAASFLVLLATAICVGMMYLFGYLFSIMAVELQESKQLFMHSFESLYSLWSSLETKFHAVFASNLQTTVKPMGMPSPSLSGEMGGTILHSLGSVFTAMTFSLLMPILTFFFLAERDALAQVFTRAYSVRNRGTLIWQKIVKATRAFFVGNLILGLITYPVFIILFRIFNVPSIFTVAALATFLNLIPFAGAVMAGFLPAVALYTQTQSVGESLGLYGCCIVIHFIVADFVTPKILGSQVNINATTSTIALVAWGELWGGFGLILAIPLTALIKILFENSNFFWLQWIAGLMSAEVPQT